MKLFFRTFNAIIQEVNESLRLLAPYAIFKPPKMWHPPASYFPIISCTFKATSSTWSQILFAGRRAVIGVGKSSQQNLNRIHSSHKTLTSAAASQTWAWGNYGINSICINHSLQQRCFSTSSLNTTNIMEKFALAKKYQGLDYNVW